MFKQSISLLVGLVSLLVCAIPTSAKTSDGRWEYKDFKDKDLWNLVLASKGNQLNNGAVEGTGTAAKIDPTKFIYLTFYYTNPVKDLSELKEKLPYLQQVVLKWNSNKKTLTAPTLDLSGLQNLVSVSTELENYLNPTDLTKKYASKNNYMNYIKIKNMDFSDCPNLRTVILDKFVNLENLNVKGSTKIERLSVAGASKLEILDLSDQPNLKSTTGSNKVYGLSIDGCHALKKIIFSDVVNTGLTAIYGENLYSLEGLDVSNLHGLEYLCVECQPSVGSGTYGKFSYLTFGEGNTSLLKLKMNNTCVTELNFEPFKNVVTDLELATNWLRRFDASEFTAAKNIDISDNHLRKVTLPGNESIVKYNFTGNRITQCPSFDKREFKPTHSEYANDKNDPKYSSITRDDGTHGERKVGKVMRYRVFDDPEMAKAVASDAFVEAMRERSESFVIPDKVSSYSEVDLDDELNQIGGHIGTTTGDMSEDPRYFYFNNDYSTGCFTIYLPYHARQNNRGWNQCLSEANAYLKVTLLRDEPAEDEQPHTFYLAGEFNDWTPTERDRFVMIDYDLYELAYDRDDDFIVGQMRVWNSPKREDATLDFGGHEIQDYVAQGHTYLEPNKKGVLHTDLDRHFTTHADKDKLQGFNSPLFQLSYAKPDDLNNLDHNWLLVSKGKNDNIVTGVEDIVVDGENTDTPVEIFTISGVKVNNAEGLAPGIYIRKQGSATSKIFIR